MFFIIICHFFQYYDNELAWWFNVGVQIFFVVSGFLYGNEDINDPILFIKKKFIKILIPYYVFLIPISVLYMLFASENITLIAFVKAVFCAGTIDGIGHLWFVGYILFCYLITPYLYWLRKESENYSILKTTSMFLLFQCLVIIVGTLFDFYFIPSRICCYIVGYFIAVCYKRYGWSIIKISAALSGILAVLINSVRIYIKYFYRINSDTVCGKLFNFAEGYAHLMLGVAIFFGMYLLLNKAKTTAIITMSDRYSYQIYIVHQLFILSPFSLMNITHIKSVNWSIVIISIFVSALLLQYITLKFMQHVNKYI